MKCHKLQFNFTICRKSPLITENALIKAMSTVSSLPFWVGCSTNDHANWHPHLFMSADMKRCGCQLVPYTWSFVNSGRDTRLTERDCDTFGRPLAPVSQANLLSCADTTRPNRVQLAGIWWDSLQSCPHNARISFRITLCGLYTADGVQQDCQSILYSVTIYAGNCMHFFQIISRK